ncbi:MAG: hypothetical protein IMF12_01305 [Proteobacteria bacterium]|nr:hypothetical protein [Pseudomonadota bacterium]
MPILDIMQNIIIIFTSLLFVVNVQAFDLFNSERGKPPPKPLSTPSTAGKNSNKLPIPFKAKASIKSTGKKKNGKLLPQRDFALKGTSIIGDKKAAILVAPDKKEFIQYFKDNKRTPINSEKFKGYYLLKVTAREAEIEYPENAPCRKNKEKEGIKCIEKSGGITIASLSLKQRKALKAPRVPIHKPLINAAKSNKRREKELEKRKKVYKNFKRKVIKDEDIPPGMRVVRTPFGDRLVPLK